MARGGTGALTLGLVSAVSVRGGGVRRGSLLWRRGPVRTPGHREDVVGRTAVSLPGHVPGTSRTPPRSALSAGPRSRICHWSPFYTRRNCSSRRSEVVRAGPGRQPHAARVVAEEHRRVCPRGGSQAGGLPPGGRGPSLPTALRILAGWEPQPAGDGLSGGPGRVPSPGRVTVCPLPAWWPSRASPVGWTRKHHSAWPLVCPHVTAVLCVDWPGFRPSLPAPGEW